MKHPEIDDALWAVIEPLLPQPKPSKTGAGRPRLSDRAALNGILFVLRTGTPWEYLPQQLGFGSGMTCWRRLRQWQEAGVWLALHQLLLSRLRSAGRLDWSRVSVDAASVASPRGVRTPAPTPRTGASWARKGTLRSMRTARRWPSSAAQRTGTTASSSPR
jgi:transposase